MLGRGRQLVPWAAITQIDAERITVDADAIAAPS